MQNIVSNQPIWAYQTIKLYGAQWRTVKDFDLYLNPPFQYSFLHPIHYISFSSLPSSIAMPSSLLALPS